jgi:diaminopimelate epimerase
MAASGHNLTSTSMGNPHAVIMVEDCEAAPVTEVGPVVEVDPAFPERTNVEFVEVENRGRLRVRTWERGVGETLACGTGAGAAAFVAHSRDLVDANVVVGLRGGELQIEIKPDGIYMTGRAAYAYRGTI